MYTFWPHGKERRSNVSVLCFKFRNEFFFPGKCLRKPDPYCAIPAVTEEPLLSAGMEQFFTKESLQSVEVQKEVLQCEWLLLLLFITCCVSITSSSTCRLKASDVTINRNIGTSVTEWFSYSTAMGNEAMETLNTRFKESFLYFADVYFTNVQQRSSSGH